MAGLRIDLLPAIGRALLDLGAATAADGLHGLRRRAEDFIWSEPPQAGRRACVEIHHHYRCHCEPPCHDCRR